MFDPNKERLQQSSAKTSAFCGNSRLLQLREVHTLPPPLPPAVSLLGYYMVSARQVTVVIACATINTHINKAMYRLIAIPNKTLLLINEPTRSPHNAPNDNTAVGVTVEWQLMETMATGMMFGCHGDINVWTRNETWAEQQVELESELSLNLSTFEHWLFYLSLVVPESNIDGKRYRFPANQPCYCILSIYLYSQTCYRQKPSTWHTITPDLAQLVSRLQEP